MNATPIEPGSTLGIFGGGQLGRMMAIAAKTMGYRVQVIDPDPNCPAHSVVDKCITSSFDDLTAAEQMARCCNAITLEIEQIPVDAIKAAEIFAPVRPGAEIMSTLQNKIWQKNWLAQHDFPVGAFHVVESSNDCKRAIDNLGRQLFLKSASGGYDGRSQVRLLDSDAEALDAAWKSLGSRPCIAESIISLDSEISVMAARSPRGELAAFSAARNHHENQILVWSAIPALLGDGLENLARELALSIAESLSFEGILAVEMFVTSDGRLLVNELAPRPHNSYHASERACATSQFEQAIRAVCNLPLGDTAVVTPSAIINLLGDLWQGGRQPQFDHALRHPGVRLHLYEKMSARAGRKMGHLSAIGPTSEIAVERAKQAYRALTAESQG